jgi:acyl dehydratase
VDYLEDIELGFVEEFGRYEVTEEEVLEYARKYDPQIFHTDPDKARELGFGGLIASGWHTCAMFMRMLVDHRLGDGNGMASPGVDDLLWLKPVRPGDVLSVISEVIEIRASKSKPDRGIIRSKFIIRNQNGEPVMSMITAAFAPRSPKAE